MHHRIVHIGNDCHVCLHLKSLQILRNKEELALIQLEEIGAVILDGYSISLTAQLASALSQKNIALIFSDEKHLPSGILMPLEGHSTHSEILKQQIECSLPKSKRVWQQIVTAKIKHQADLLSFLGKEDKKINTLIDKVKSGDPENIEGQVANKYWRVLLGKNFKRDFDEPGANAMLNYTYAIIRSAVARSLVGAGLHPALGVHHKNRYNAMALADDAMEPLRPLADLLVNHYLSQNKAPEELTPTLKKYLVKVLVFPLEFAGNEMTFLDACERYSASLRRGICEEARKIQIPRPLWSQSIEECGSW